MHPLAELARLFLKLGTISFGGPAASIALMEHEVVLRRRWLSREEFLDLIAATNLIPGPNAVEMASHVGYRRAGLLGSVMSGVCFTLPAVTITIALAWSYQRYGRLPEVEPFLCGVKAAVLAVIATAVYRLAKQALRRWQLALVGAGVAAASLVEDLLGRGDEVLLLLAGSAIGVLLLRWSRPGDGWHWRHASGTPGKTAVGALAGTMLAGAAGSAQAAAATAAAGTAASAAVPLWKLGLFFLKVGVVWFGGGYVLVAYLDGRVPEWLSRQQLLDAVAIGQLTPGPMLSMVTFVGYLVGGGVGGAVVATAAILLPSFFFVAVLNPLIPRLRHSAWAARLLDTVGAAAIGLMAGVTLTLCYTALVGPGGFPWIDWRSCLIALAAGVALLRWDVAPARLVLAGSLAGWLLWAFPPLAA
jgi:chromate transporter